MALLSTLSGAELTKLRSDDYRVFQYVALCPNTVVMQATVATAPTANTWAQVTINTPTTGSVSAIDSFQTVIFSETSDYRATETYRTYMRAGSTGTTLNIAENSQSVAVNDYITVLDTYEVFEKPAIERGGTLYFDWDITFRKILPVETSLPTAVVLTGGTTSYSPTSSPSALDDDATSSFTHSWSSSNSNDSVMSATTNNPSFTLEAGAFRWIRYEFTDSNGNTGLRVIAVWTVPKDLSASASLGFVDERGSVAQIGYDDEAGWTCTVPAFDGVDSVLEGTFMCVFSVNTYNGTEGAIRSNIDFVGYLGEETTRTRGDEQFGVISEVAFTCNSISTLMAQAPVSTLSITATDSPTAWFDVDSPTPVRIAWLLLSELSTVGHLCSMSFFSDHTDFIGNGDVFSNTPDVLFDAIREIVDTVNARLQYDTNGRFDLVRDLVILDDTARNAADTVVQLSPDDWLDYNLRFDPNPQVRQIKVAGGWFDTSFNVYTPRIAYAPAIVNNRGTNTPEIVNQVLTTDSTQAQGEAELLERTANLYARVSPTPILDVTAKDEWYFLVPERGAWFTLDIEATDTARGFSYDSNTRWQLISVSHDTNTEQGRRTVNLQFRPETQDTGAFVAVTAPQETETDNPQPITAPPYTDADFDEWWDRIDTGDPAYPNPSPSTCEEVGFRVKQSPFADTISTYGVNDDLEITIRGSGRLVQTLSPLTRTVDFDGAYTDYTTSVVAINGATVSGGVVSGGNPGDCFEGETVSSGTSEGVQIVLTVDLGEERTVETIDLDVYIFGSFGSSTNHNLTIRVFDDTQTLISTVISENRTLSARNTWEATTQVDADVAGVRYVEVALRVNTSPTTPATQGIRMDNVAIALAGETVTQGDAFYYSEDGGAWTAYNSGDGFRVNGADVPSIPPYNPQHVYTLFQAGIGSDQSYRFNSPYGNSNADNWSIQTKTCIIG